MSKRIKELITADVIKKIGDTRDFLVLNTSRLDAFTQNSLRLKLREQSISALTVKNTLARRAFVQNGVGGLDSFLKGPTTLVWGASDIVALSKEITKWAKELKELEIKGGTVEGKAVSVSEVESLSKSPGRIELVSKIIGLALAPGRQITSSLIGTGGKLTGQITSISEKNAVNGVSA